MNPAGAARVPGGGAWPALALALLLAATGCAQQSGSGTAQPQLTDVPALPHLTYSIEQRQAIGNELLADKANARYEGEQLRYQTGQPGAAPPQPQAPATMPPVPPSTTAVNGQPNAEVAYVREQVRNESDDGSLTSFVRRLVHGEPPATPSTPVDTAGSTTAAAATPAQPATPPSAKPTKQKKEAPARPPALDGLVSYLGGLLGMDLFQPKPASPSAAPKAAGAKGAAAPASSPAPAPTATPRALTPATVETATAEQTASAATAEKEQDRLPLSVIAGEQAAGQVRFASGLAIPAEATEQLRTLVGQARVMGSGLRVVGHAADPAESLDRARAVAEKLVSLGAPGDRLDIEAGGPGEATLVYLSPRSAS